MDGLVQRCGEWWDNVGEDVFLYRDRASFSNKRICARRYRMLTFKLRSAEMTSMRMRVSCSLIWDRKTVIFYEGHCVMLRDRKRDVLQHSAGKTAAHHCALAERATVHEPRCESWRSSHRRVSGKSIRSVTVASRRRTTPGGSGVGSGGSGRSGQMERTTLSHCGNEFFFPHTLG